MKIYNTVFLLFFILIACNKSTEEQFYKDDDKINKYNLFIENNNLKVDETLSFEQAFEKSNIVIKTINLVKVDSTKSRGVNPFFVYKITNGIIEKNLEKQKLDLPFYFIAQDRFYKNKIFKDSIFVFLQPFKNHKVLKNNTLLKNQWLDKAPFTNQK